MAQQQMYSAIANSPGTELSAAITAAVTTIPVVTGSVLPEGPNIITIGVDETSETVLYTSKSGNSLIGCTRGFGGTTAKGWAVASRVARYYTAYDHESFRKNLTDLSGVTSESTTDVILSAGQQILNATKNARLQGLKVQGRTLIDLLGGAGSGESLTGFTQGGGAAEISTTQKRSGNSSFKFVATAGNKYLHKDYDYPIDSSKQYILGAWVFLESFTAGYISYGLRQKGTMTVVAESTVMDTSKIGSWQFVHAKVPLGSVFPTSGFRLLFGPATAAANMTVYIDEVRLYAVSAADYAAIGTTITGEAIDRLLPYVPPGINGVDGLWVRRYGRNLYDGGIASSSPGMTYVENNQNSITVTSSAALARYATTKKYPVLPNTVYTLSFEGINVSGGVDAPRIWVRKGSDNGAINAAIGTGFKSLTFNTGTETEIIFYIYASTDSATVQTKRYDNIQLEIGSTATPFQPREDSLIAFGGVELHANPNDGSEPDILREVNGRYEVTKLWREITLSGLQDWTVLSTHTGYKRLRALGIAPTLSDSSMSALVKFDGKVLTQTFSDVPSSAAADVYRTSASGNTTVTVSSTDSGWGDSYTPSTDEIKAYFNGYQMGSVSGATFTTPYISGTKAWRFVMGDPSTGTSTLPTTLNPGYAGWQPYQLLYRLANTVIETIQEDGALSLIEGDNFIEVGSGYVSRERANPVMTIVGGSSFYHFNNAEPTVSASKFRYPVQKILGIYEASLPARGVVLKNESVAFGLQDAHIEGINYNLNAPYSASYIKLDKSPVPVVTGFYAATEKMQLHDLTDAVTEISSTVSALAAKKAEKDAPGWIAPTLLNGFTALFSSRVPSYRKVNGVVEFTGALKFTSSTVNANLVIFRLPEGYRPKDQLDFGVLSGSGANRVFGGLEIMPTGEVYVLSGMGGDAIFLDGLPTFRVE
ncbi:hypothetical protein NYE47_00950 [Paenibacillus sp. FSL H7-0941]|uniref:hypothetical protein n=1 Tax=Paenibacillus sp. FSL H7-0941 TaxID=2975351 RepID=UPI0030F5656F